MRVQTGSRKQSAPTIDEEAAPQDTAGTGKGTDTDTVIDMNTGKNTGTGTGTGGVLDMNDEGQQAAQLGVAAAAKLVP